MKRSAFPFALALAFATSLATAPARADEIDPHAAKAHVEAARQAGFNAFCTNPPRPLVGRQRGMCELASELKDCTPLVEACRTEPKTEMDTGSVALMLAAAARTLVWVLAAFVLVALLFPLLRLLAKLRADRAVSDVTPETKGIAAAPLPAAPVARISDAEAALRAADEHATRGEPERAMSLYPAPALVPLARRGAVRLAQHRTNGEYVRLCTEADARPPLRAIVREVDKIEFGGIAPTRVDADAVSAHARALVRRAATTAATMALLLVCALGLAGCGMPRGPFGGADPMGDELPREVLRRSGYQIAGLPSSLATLPIPTTRADLPVVVVDGTRVPLDDEARAHLLRWIEAGGVLVMFGDVEAWPKELGAKHDVATTRELTFVRPPVDDEESNEGDRPKPVTGARVARLAGVTWKDAVPIAGLGDHLYAARVVRSGGAFVGIAGSDLFTNVGVAHPPNAAALVAILEAARVLRLPPASVFEPGEMTAEIAMPFLSSTKIMVAREEDGIAPPSNPFSSLVHAGLGKGAWHALVAALVLFLAFGLRHARPRPAKPPARRAFAEHVEATGAFYGRTKALAHALAAYGRFAELRIRGRLPRGADPIAYLSGRSEVPRAEVERIWTRATTAKTSDAVRGDELQTIRDLRALLAKAV